jgi:hypothetical protein
MRTFPEKLLPPCKLAPATFREKLEKCNILSFFEIFPKIFDKLMIVFQARNPFVLLLLMYFQQKKKLFLVLNFNFSGKASLTHGHW